MNTFISIMLYNCAIVWGGYFIKVGEFLMPDKMYHAAAQKIDFQKQLRYFFLGLTVKLIGLSLPG